METRNFPPHVVVLSLLTLGLIGFFGFIRVSMGLELWLRFEGPETLLGILGKSIMYVLLPALAVIDILRRNAAGRYLAILAFMCSAAALLGMFVDDLLRPVRFRSFDGIVAVLCFLFPLLVIGLILGLTLEKDSNRYFESGDKSQDAFPASMPIESVLLSFAHENLLTEPHAIFEPINHSPVQRDIG
jgi:hypothetical protein